MPNVFSYSQGPIAFNPNDGCLFVTGHVYYQQIAEVSIPPLVNGKLDDMNTAKIIQPFGPSPLKGLKYNDTADPVGDIGGLIVIGNQMYGTAYVYYDTNYTMFSDWYSSSLDLANMAITGLCQVGTLGGGIISGYIFPIPAGWQSDLGAPYITGQTMLPIVSRTSCGPAAFGFDPSKLSPTRVDPDIPYVYYPENHQTLGAWSSSPPTLFNGNANAGGGIFVPGTRSVLFFGAVGLGPFCYGDPNGPVPGAVNSDGAEDCNDPYRGGKGQHSYGGKYGYEVWAYDANDFLAAKNGKLQPWQVMPYATWSYQFPTVNPGCFTGGVSYDPASGRIYISQLGADTEAQDSYLPVIHAFKITGIGTSPSPTSPSPTPQAPHPKTHSPKPSSESAAARATAKAAEAKAKAEAKAAEEKAKAKAKAAQTAAKAAQEKAKEEEKAAEEKASHEK